ncbi:MAG TPA: YdeI/OmpD-associated family protein [Bacteroidia bacterium]|nr:YdeI/OmpD-associated family protein [Bacteroidia bacterium]HNS11899.1 YdeI/OmpD-associated family protein [Bacteroidia bacterium]
MKAKFFSDQTKFREWLQKNHDKESELIVGFYRVSCAKPSMTWSQAVDQALCYGWIDGIRRRIDDESYSNRFTPRRRNSNWSDINIKKVKDLTKAGQMKEAGLQAFEMRKKIKLTNDGSKNGKFVLDKDLQSRFKKQKLAWDFFNDQPLSYKKMMMRWIMSARQVKTRLSRLEMIVAESKECRRLSNR